MNNSIAIYASSIDKYNDSINIIYNKYHNSHDIVLFTENIGVPNFNHCAIFPSFYMKFFDGTVVFLTIQDYLIYKNHIKGEPILLVDNHTYQNLDESIIGDINILVIEKDKK